MDVDNIAEVELEENELLIVLYGIMNTFTTFLNMIYAFFVLSETELPTDGVHLRKCYGLGCLGALDGTYINVTVHVQDRARYHNRKGDISINILADCDIHINYV
ncbi:hypothetical protein ACS0TY_032604 [Phlomoides rotata]